MEALDRLDTKLLYEIDLHPRQSLNVLARKLRINRNTADYRLSKLLQTTVIKNFYAIIHGYGLGFTYYKYFLKTNSSNLSPKELWKESSIVWIGKTDGYWDYAITLRAKTQFELSAILKKIDISLDVKDKSLLLIHAATVFNERFFTQKKDIREITNAFTEKAPFETDKTDDIIIKTLSGDARQTLVAIAKLVKLTPEAVKKRIRRLEKANIILGYKARINYTLLGYEYYHLLLTIRKHEAKKRISSFLKQFPTCVALLELQGQYDIQAEFIAKSYSEIRNVIDTMKETFPAEIETIDKLYIMEESLIKTF